MKLMVDGFSNLPLFHGTLFRGVKGDFDVSDYAIGQIINWWGFSSCTTSIEALQNEMFLGTAGERTLICIEHAVGVDIRPFSFFQKEAEVVLPAGASLLVRGHLNLGKGLRMIQATMVQSDSCILDLNSHLPSASDIVSPARVRLESQDTDIHGLTDVFSTARIGAETRSRILAWCTTKRAAELEEILFSIDDINTECELTTLEKRRLERELQAVVSVHY
jgi:hypothetical protein